jgi:hypothetical protein
VRRSRSMWSNWCLDLTGCALAVALTRVVGSLVTSLTHVAAGETMPAAQAPIRWAAK